MQQRIPKVISLTVNGGTTYVDNLVSVPANTVAAFAQIANKHSTQDLLVKINGKSDAIFILENASTQVFNNGDLLIRSLAFSNASSGAANVNVEIIFGLTGISG